jgi:hypothetical protein
VPAVIVAPMVAFSYATVGAPYPATAAAKVEGGLIGWLGGLREPLATTLAVRPWAFMREWVAWLWLTHVLLRPPAASGDRAGLAPRGSTSSAWSRWTLLAHPARHGAAGRRTGPRLQEGRYSIHLLPAGARGRRGRARGLRCSDAADGAAGVAGCWPCGR